MRFETATSRRWLLMSGVIIILSIAGASVLYKRGTFETAAGRRWAMIEGALLISSLIAGWISVERTFFVNTTRKWVGLVGTTLAVTLFIGSVTFFWPPYGGTAPTYPYLRLATSAGEYDRFDLEHPITLSLTIALPPVDPNRSTISTVQLYGPTTIFISKLTRDGVPIKPITSAGAYFPAFSDFQEAGLYQLQHNEWQPISFDITPVGNGVWEIDDVDPRGAYSQILPDPINGGQRVIEHPEHEVRAFVLDQPGLYTLQLRYQYGRYHTDLAGLERTRFGDQYVFYGPVVSNEVSFRLR